jgi:feruloyl esterase
VVRLHRALRATPESLPTPEKFQALRKAILAACAPTDSGPSGDAWLLDPAACKFDPETIRCKEADGPDCLSAAQVEAVRKIYAGPRNPRTGATVYPGIPLGGEGMNRYLGFVAGQAQPPWDATIRWVFGAQWDAATFDFDRDEATLEEVLGPMLDASSSNLSRFAKRGGKLILWHGWMDGVNPTGSSVDYYKQLVAAQKGSLAATRRFARLFLVPGVGHCAGGPGPDGFGVARPAAADDAENDMLLAVVRWVEQGVAPSRIIASKFVGDDRAKGVVFQRPLCPYPEVAQYRGEGERTAASSFACRSPR